MLEKSDDKIVYLSEVKTKCMLLKIQSLVSGKINSNIKKLLTVNNKNIIYPDCLAFEDVLELYLNIKENTRKPEYLNEVQQDPQLTALETKYKRVHIKFLGPSKLIT